MLTNWRRNLAAAVSLAAAAAVVGTVCLALPAQDKGINLVLPDTTAIESAANRRTQPEPAADTVSSAFTTDGYDKMLENERLELWFAEDTASVRVVDKSSGYVWGCIGEEAVDLSRRWESFAQSLFSIEYYDADLNEKRIALSDPTASCEYFTEERELVCEADFPEQGISMTVKIAMEEDGLRFSLQNPSIEEYGDCLLKSVYFVPFFGSTYADEIPGYMFIPDGPGALMRYSKPAEYISMFSKRIYGADGAIDPLEEANALVAKRTDDYLVDIPQVSLPVFGAVHGARQHAFLAVVERGEEYAYIQACPAGVSTDYNWVTARFEYRSMYTHPTGRDGVGFSVPQEEANRFDAAVCFKLLTGNAADYSGMAVKYRDMLTAQERLGKERQDSQIPLRLDIMGAEVHKGVFLTRKTLTTAEQAADIAMRLDEDGISNLTMAYKGWQNGGYSGSKYGKTAANKQVADLADMQALRDAVQSRGGRFYLSMNPTTVNESQINKSMHAIRTIGQQYAKLVRPNPYVLFPDTYFVRSSVMKNTVEKAAKALAGFNLHFEKTGAWLSSDFTRGEVVTRTQAAAHIKEAVSRPAGRVALDAVNAYLFSEADDYFDCPLVNSQYLYETDTVPFLQIVLKGHMDLYAPYMNQGLYTNASVLKMVEYGVYPSFLVMNAENTALNKTPLEDYFSLSFKSWRGTIQEVYSKLDAALTPVEGAHISEHIMLAKGLARVTYDNGVRLYINYLYTDQAADGVTVPAESFAVRGGAG